MDIASGNVRIRNINSNEGIKDKDKIVVADDNGVLRTKNSLNISLFHAILAHRQNIIGSQVNILFFKKPLVLNPALYHYDPNSGILTFNQPGNYMVTLQVSFTRMMPCTQLLIGIKTVADGSYIGRASGFSALCPPTPNVGEIVGYRTVITVPKPGYGVYFIAGTHEDSIVLDREVGYTGSGNVTNVIINRL